MLGLFLSTSLYIGARVQEQKEYYAAKAAREEARAEVGEGAPEEEYKAALSEKIQRIAGEQKLVAGRVHRMADIQTRKPRTYGMAMQPTPLKKRRIDGRVVYEPKPTPKGLWEVTYKEKKYITPVKGWKPKEAIAEQQAIARARREAEITPTKIAPPPTPPTVIESAREYYAGKPYEMYGETFVTPTGKEIARGLFFEGIRKPTGIAERYAKEFLAKPMEVSRAISPGERVTGWAKDISGKAVKGWEIKEVSLFEAAAEERKRLKKAGLYVGAAGALVAGRVIKTVSQPEVLAFAALSRIYPPAGITYGGLSIYQTLISPEERKAFFGEFKTVRGAAGMVVELGTIGILAGAGRGRRVTRPIPALKVLKPSIIKIPKKFKPKPLAELKVEGLKPSELFFERRTHWIEQIRETGKAPPKKIIKELGLKEVVLGEAVSSAKIRKMQRKLLPKDKKPLTMKEMGEMFAEKPKHKIDWSKPSEGYLKQISKERGYLQRMGVEPSARIRKILRKKIIKDIGDKKPLTMKEMGGVFAEKPKHKIDWSKPSEGYLKQISKERGYLQRRGVEPSARIRKILRKGYLKELGGRPPSLKFRDPIKKLYFEISKEKAAKPFAWLKEKPKPKTQKSMFKPEPKYIERTTKEGLVLLQKLKEPIVKMERPKVKTILKEKPKLKTITKPTPLADLTRFPSLLALARPKGKLTELMARPSKIILPSRVTFKLAPLTKLTIEKKPGIKSMLKPMTKPALKQVPIAKSAFVQKLAVAQKSIVEQLPAQKQAAKLALASTSTIVRSIVGTRDIFGQVTGTIERIPKIPFTMFRFPEPPKPKKKPRKAPPWDIKTMYKPSLVGKARYEMFGEVIKKAPKGLVGVGIRPMTREHVKMLKQLTKPMVM